MVMVGGGSGSRQGGGIRGFPCLPLDQFHVIHNTQCPLSFVSIQPNALPSSSSLTPLSAQQPSPPLQPCRRRGRENEGCITSNRHRPSLISSPSHIDSLTFMPSILIHSMSSSFMPSPNFSTPSSAQCNNISKL